MACLVYFGSSEGQTQKIAEHIGDNLQRLGLKVDVVQAPLAVDLEAYDGVIIGDSVHMGRYHKELIQFVETNRDRLQKMPSAFFSVCLGIASKNLEDQLEARSYVDGMIKSYNWRPQHIAIFPGALLYREYNPILRFIIKNIAQSEGLETDTKRSHEYTRWEEVSEFAHDVAQTITQGKPLSAPDSITPPMSIALCSRDQEIHGIIAPGFEEVRKEFELNFQKRGEVGAAVAAYWRGKKVVDLWGGLRDQERRDPWEKDTLVVFMSGTKGLAAMTLFLANARGWLDYDATVAHYWPEFAQCEKSTISIRQLLAHQAGLVTLDQALPISKLTDLDWVAERLAKQRPLWKPEEGHGYHTMTLGLYMQELIRRVDPKKRTLGQFFQEEIAQPLGLEFYIGLPKSIPSSRLAKIETLSPVGAITGLRSAPAAFLKKALRPGSLLFRSYRVFEGLDWNDRRSLDVELPASNGVGTARGVARAYCALAQGGGELGICSTAFARLVETPTMTHFEDKVLGVPTCFSLGFLRPGPDLDFASSRQAFGAPGAGGSFAFADPNVELGFAYAMNKLDYYLSDDPREKSLRDAVYRSIERQS